MRLDGYDGLHHLNATFGPAAATAAVMPRGQRTDSVVAGIFWVTLAMALFAGVGVFARAAILAGVPPLEVVFFRNLLATLAMLPLLAVRGFDLMRTEAFGLYGLRCGLSAMSMAAWFSALALMPLGELTAIGFLAPLFGTLAAVLILGEVVRSRRWTALLVGFCGALIILRPGFGGFGIGQGLAICSAVSGGLLAVLIKQLTARDDPNRIVFLTNLILTALTLPPALFVWVWPAAEAYPLLLGMGLCAVVGHVALTRAFAAMEASLVLSFEFSKLPFAVGAAYLAFGETIDGATWFGAAIIFASAVYISRREAQIRRQKTIDAVVDTVPVPVPVPHHVR